MASTVCFALLVLAAPRARGAACGGRDWPWVRLADDGLPAALRAAVVAQLRAGLEARQIELCVTADAQTAPASEIALAVAPGEVVTVAMRDAITGKRLAREVALAAVPADARPLTIALAVDELLRASWVELTLADAPVPAQPVPREIAALVAAPARLTEPRRWELGAALAAERFGGGTSLAGVDLAVRAATGPRLSVRVALGLRAGATVHAPDGDIRTTAFDADVGLEAALPPRDRRVGLALALDGRVMRARFAGDARVGARGGDVTATAFYVSAGLRGRARLTPAFGLSLACGLGVPVHAVEVFDGDARVAGLSGPLLSLALGGWWRSP